MTTHRSSASHPTSSKSPRILLPVSHFYTFWVTGKLLQCILLVCTAYTALKHSVQHMQSPLVGIAFLFAYSTNSSAFSGLCFFMFYFSFLWPLLSYLFRFCIMFLNALSKCRILTIQGKITGCYIHSHACIQRTLLSQTID